MNCKVSVILPSSMFLNDLGEQFIAVILKNKKYDENKNNIFKVNPEEKIVEEIELNDDINHLLCNTPFDTIDGTPFNIFYIKGNAPWDINIPEYNRNTFSYKGESYITGNMYREGLSTSWKVLPVKFSLKDVEEWIFWKK